MLVETYMVDAELNEDNEIVVDDVVFAIRPVAHAGTAAGLVGVLSATVQLVFTVRHSSLPKGREEEAVINTFR